MYLLKMVGSSVIIILIVIAGKCSPVYSDEASTEAVQKMPVTGNVVKEKDKNISSDSDEEVNEAKKININTADIEELKTLPGVGPVIAKRIIQYRKAHGRFNTIEEIKNIEGIGEKKFKKIKNMITVNKKGTVLFTDEATQ